MKTVTASFYKTETNDGNVSETKMFQQKRTEMSQQKKQVRHSLFHANS